MILLPKISRGNFLGISVSAYRLVFDGFMVFCNELGSQSLNIYHKLRLQSRLTKYSFLKIRKFIFSELTLVLKKTKIFLNSIDNASVVTEFNQKSSRSNHTKFWLLSQNCHQFKDVTNRARLRHQQESVRESTRAKAQSTSNRQSSQIGSPIRDLRSKIGRYRNLENQGPNTRSRTRKDHRVT